MLPVCNEVSQPLQLCDINAGKEGGKKKESKSAPPGFYGPNSGSCVLQELDNVRSSWLCTRLSSARRTLIQQLNQYYHCGLALD